MREENHDSKSNEITSSKTDSKKKLKREMFAEDSDDGEKVQSSYKKHTQASCFIQGQEMIGCFICGELLSANTKIGTHFIEKTKEFDLTHSGIDS